MVLCFFGRCVNGESQAGPGAGPAPYSSWFRWRTLTSIRGGAVLPRGRTGGRGSGRHLEQELRDLPQRRHADGQPPADEPRGDPERGRLGTGGDARAAGEEPAASGDQLSRPADAAVWEAAASANRRARPLGEARAAVAGQRERRRSPGPHRAAPGDAGDDEVLVVPAGSPAAYSDPETSGVGAKSD